MKKNFKSDLDGGELAKIRYNLAEILKDIINKNGWSQSCAAEKMNIDRTHLCKIINNSKGYISELKLISCLIEVGYDINIEVCESEKESGSIKINYEKYSSRERSSGK